MNRRSFFACLAAMVCWRPGRSTEASFFDRQKYLDAIKVRAFSPGSRPGVYVWSATLRDDSGPPLYRPGKIYSFSGWSKPDAGFKLYGVYFSGPLSLAGEP